MKSKTKKILFILGVSGAAVVLAAVAFLLTFDMNSYKPRIEAAASTATGMNVLVNGKMKLSLFPGVGISLEDIIIQNNGTVVASAKEAHIKLRLLPLIRRKVLIRQLRFVTPSLFITRDRDGRFNFETTEKKPAPMGPFEMEKILIVRGHATYLDVKSGGKTEAKNCDLSIQNLSSGWGESFGALSFDGHLSCEEMKEQELRISDIRADMNVRKGKLEASPFTMRIFGGDCKGSIKGMMSGESREYSIDLALTKFRFEEVLGTFNQKQTIHGEMDMKLHLAMKGNTSNELTRSAHGDVSIRGNNLSLASLDIDRMLNKYEKSQNFNLVDLGAFFVVGPMGTVITKGYDFGRAYMESLGGTSTILKLVSDWKVRNGIAEAEDVAFITRKNRVALNGKLDFVHDRFEDVTVAVLNDNGCATYSQRIHGSFNKPQIDKPNIFLSLIGPAISLASKSYEMLKGGKCDVIYQGTLQGFDGVGPP